MRKVEILKVCLIVLEVIVWWGDQRVDFLSPIWLVSVMSVSFEVQEV